MTHSSTLRYLCLIFFCSFLLSTHPALSQGTSYSTTLSYYEPWTEPPEHTLDMQRMRVEVSFVPEQGLVKGRVTHIFAPIRSRVDSFFFNGPGIRILTASLNNSPLRFRESTEGITTYFNPPLQWGAPDSITFLYQAHPRRGLYFVGWNDPKNLHRKQIWTQGQGIDNRYWIPCYDGQNDKLITETIIRFDSEYQVLSNGRKLAETENGDGTTTWHFAMSHPHSSYLVMLGIGKYKVKTVYSKRGVPIHLWYYPEYPEREAPTFIYSEEAMDFMEKETGVQYPWEAYSQIPVSDFLYGGMENTTATVFGDALLVGPREFLDQNYIGVNIHELAHQWFGDYVTARSDRSSWLQESFATFYAKLFQRSIFGEDHYEWMRRLEHNAALAESEQNRLPVLHSQAGRARVYQKGSAVLDMMMYTFGAEECKRVITSYLTHHAYGNVETNDLYQAFQDVLGLTPFSFFEQWIYRGGEPHFDVQYHDVTASGTTARRTDITIRQVHKTDDLVKLFSVPVVCRVHYADGTFDERRVLIEKQTEIVTIQNPGRREIAFVLFDPGSHILKKVTFEKSFEELKSQAFRAPHMIDRYDAVVAMRSLEVGTKRDALVGLFKKDRFHAIRSEVLSQLIHDTDAKSRGILQAALSDRDAKVRTSAMSSTDTIPAQLRAQFENLLKDSSYGIVTAALGKLSTRFPDRVPNYLAATRNLTGPGKQVGILWHELNASLGNTASVDSLIEYAGPSYEYHTRVNAFEALKRLNILTGSLIPHLFDAMVHFNGRLRAPATAVAAYFYQQSDAKKMLQAYYASQPWEPWQQELLKTTIN